MALKFGRGNAKLDALESKTGKQVYTFSLLSGFTCPYAKDCLSKAVIDSNGKRHIKDGPDTQFRCFSASQEVLFTNVYKQRAENFRLLREAKTADKMSELIQSSLPRKAGIIRIHVGGDFFSQEYMYAWLRVAKMNPDKIFYAYTKSLQYWVNLRSIIDSLPNMVMTASYGGRLDNLIELFNLRYAKVVFSRAEAKQLKLPIDHDDSHAALPKLRNKSFALLLHGVQPKGSKAGKALVELNGDGSYTK